MTKEQKKIQDKIDRLYLAIAREVGSSTMDLIDELIECELLLEAECNQ